MSRFLESIISISSLSAVNVNELWTFCISICWMMIIIMSEYLICRYKSMIHNPQSHYLSTCLNVYIVNIIWGICFCWSFGRVRVCVCNLFVDFSTCSPFRWLMSHSYHSIYLFVRSSIRCPTRNSQLYLKIIIMVTQSEKIIWRLKSMIVYYLLHSFSCCLFICSWFVIRCSFR